MKKVDREVVVESIKKYEGYEELKPWKRKRNILLSENGEVVIINTTQSLNQSLEKGNFQEILNDKDVWEYICKLRRGSYWVIVFVNGKATYYRTDLKIIISNREKDTPSKDIDRYLIHIKISDVINGNTFLNINGGNNQQATLFVMTKVDLEGGFKEMPCYVYLMTDSNNGVTKIGVSENPSYRERTLQSEKPNITLKKMLWFQNRNEARAKETELHNRYKEYKTRGEWFLLSDTEIVTLLNEYDWRKPSY